MKQTKETKNGKIPAWVLLNNEAKNEMFCFMCRDQATGDMHRQSSYLIGCTTFKEFKLEGIKDHERSILQEHCIKIIQARKDPSQTDGARSVKSLTQQQTDNDSALTNSTCPC